MFGDGLEVELDPVVNGNTLHAGIGVLALEDDAPQRLRGPTGVTPPAPISGALGKGGLVPSASK